ncbi:MAG TPA: LysR family transcriptional regulator [Usitatibacter sp.]|nr:LysR family transcriptional regulator [Usitatibacter sp.]
MARTPLRRFFRHGFLPQLIAFEACVRLGSVTRAAEELSLAQPTVSCMLRKLSETLGGPVTVIRERRVEASPLGREVLLLCQDFFHAMERFEERQQGRRGGGGGEGVGYDRLADPSVPEFPWPPSPSLPRSRSRWKQRASQCPRAKRRPAGAGGAS